MSTAQAGSLTDAEWRAFQAIPEQGYSHRAWLDHLIAKRLRTAWDEGYVAGQAFGYEYAQDTYDGPAEDPTPNPYEKPEPIVRTPMERIAFERDWDRRFKERQARA